MEMLYHLVAAEEWERSKGASLYTAPSLSSQGFLHASGSVEQALRVANRRFRGRGQVLVLCIDRARVRAEIRYEEGGDPEPFPHIFGPLNTDAIVEVRELRRDPSGQFVGLHGGTSSRSPPLELSPIKGESVGPFPLDGGRACPFGKLRAGSEPAEGLAGR